MRSDRFDRIKIMTKRLKESKDGGEFATSLMLVLEGDVERETIARLYLRYISAEQRQRYRARCNELAGSDIWK